MHFIKIIIVISLFLSPFTPIAQSSNTFIVAVEVNDQIITNYELSQRIKMLGEQTNHTVHTKIA